MNRPRVDLAYVGPLKRGAYVRSESPLEEVWNWIARFGISGWLQKNTSAAKPWKDWGPYSVVRVRQAVEFRAAARQGSILTRPLPLYYSLLNLLRGFFAMSQGAEPKKKHGLIFVRESEPNIFQTGAELTDGTFTDYLDALKIPRQKKSVITLGEALLRIIETAADYISASIGQAEVFQVNVEAYQQSGRVRLHFYGTGQEDEFRNSWQEWFPKLRGLCSAESTGRMLMVDVTKVNTTTREAISDFCHKVLEVNLKSYEDPSWYAIRHSKPELDLPRPALYFIGAFILSSVVRYRPESLLTLSDPDSEDGWLIERFLNAAERYFPHLLLHWVSGEVYF
jgi:YaaC-like Protein